MNTEQLNALYEKLEVKSRRGRGGDYTYVPWQDVADRMNKVFNGNWSSEIKSEISTEGGIVVRVRVTVIDQNTNQEYYQEGYGGASITNTEIGTLHKSAYSKALRDACKKWGPGLYTDDISDFSNKSKTTIPSSPSKPPVTKMPISSVPSSPIVSKATEPVKNIGIPPSTNHQTHKSVVEQIASTPSLPGTQKSIMPPITEVKSSLPPVATIPTSSSTVSNQINDVQTAALDGILELKDISFEELIKEAFEDSKLDITNLPTKEKLTYQQAVMVIKYGNEKFRK